MKSDGDVRVEVELDQMGHAEVRSVRRCSLNCKDGLAPTTECRPWLEVRDGAAQVDESLAAPDELSEVKFGGKLATDHRLECEGESSLNSIESPPSPGNISLSNFSPRTCLKESGELLDSLAGCGLGFWTCE